MRYADVVPVAGGQRLGDGELVGPLPAGLPRGSQEDGVIGLLLAEAVGEVELGG